MFHDLIFLCNVIFVMYFYVITSIQVITIGKSTA